MVDATTQAALQATVVYWRVLIYADFSDEALRVTTGLYDKTVSGSGDSELDGTYLAIDERLLGIGPVRASESGSETVVVTLNALLASTDILLDRADGLIQDRDYEYIQIRSSAFLNSLGDKAIWQGRVCRLWFYCVDEDETQVGSIIPYYTGYMNDVSISGSPELQTAALTIENYIVSLSGAQNKNYLMQDQYDSGDLSAEAAIAAANGTEGAGLADTAYQGGYSYATGSNRWRDALG